MLFSGHQYARKVWLPFTMHLKLARVESVIITIVIVVLALLSPVTDQTLNRGTEG